MKRPTTRKARPPQKPPYHGCVICDKPATRRFSPDLDIRGLGSCKKHEEIVQIAYSMMMQGDRNMYEQFIRSVRAKQKK